MRRVEIHNQIQVRILCMQSPSDKSFGVFEGIFLAAVGRSQRNDPSLLCYVFDPLSESWSNKPYQPINNLITNSPFLHHNRKQQTVTAWLGVQRTRQVHYPDNIHFSWRILPLSLHTTCPFHFLPECSDSTPLSFPFSNRISSARSLLLHIPILYLYPVLPSSLIPKKNLKSLFTFCFPYFKLQRIVPFIDFFR